MKRKLLFFFLLGALVFNGCQRSVDVSEINQDDPEYHVETFEVRSDNDIKPESEIVIEGKKYSLIDYEDKILDTVKGYDIETMTETFQNVVKDVTPISEIMKKDNLTYILKDISNTDGPERQEKITKSMTYTDMFPEEIFVEKYMDDISKKEVEVTYHLVDYTSSQAWVDDLNVPLTIYDYDSYYYQIGNSFVTSTDDSIDISGAETDILAFAGMDTSIYQLYGAYWNGNVINNQRNAIAYGSRLQTTYEAIYEAKANLPKLSTAAATYEYKVANPEKDVQIIQRKAVYKENRVPFVVIVSVSFVVIILIILLFVNKLRKKEDK